MSEEQPFFEVVAECPHTRARTGRLHTAHGAVETPVFMPVGTQATVKALTPRVLAEELGAEIILGNTYHLFLRPGHERVGEFGGIHGFAAWERAILTDSGGFQVWSLKGLRKLSEEGVVFRSHLDGSEHRFTPESTIDIQRSLGADIAMVLDECTDYPATEQHARESMERTIRWAGRAMRHHRETPFTSAQPNHGQRVFPIVQGSMYPELRRECAERLLELDAPGYALGGLSVGESPEVSYAMVEATEPVLPRDKPRYVMGVGMLDQLGEYVARGVDMMDCVLPTRNARNGFLFTSWGHIHIKNAAFAGDSRPVDEQCGCYCCQNFSRAYLRHLFLAKEILYSMLASLHNVAIYLDTMRSIRQAIVIGDLPDWLARMREAHGAAQGPS